jgi:hypothetical protein
MSLVGYSSYFTKIEQFKEGGGENLNLSETLVNESLNDIEELSNTNECYQQQGIEVTNKNSNYSIVSQRSTSTKNPKRVVVWK